jgi:hypothetical protein
MRQNWEQVFGVDPWLWLLPLYGRSGKPVGSGVSWELRPDLVPNDRLQVIAQPNVRPLLFS